MAQEFAYLDQLMDRLVKAEIKALMPFGKVDAKPFSVWWQETFPYFTNRLAEDTPEELAADHDRHVYTVRIRLVVAHVAGRLDGDAERKLRRYIPAIQHSFHHDYWLDPDGEGAIPELDATSVVFTRSNGVQIFVNTAVPGHPAQLGTEFAISAAFIDDDEPEYD